MIKLQVESNINYKLNPGYLQSVGGLMQDLLMVDKSNQNVNPIVGQRIKRRLADKKQTQAWLAEQIKVTDNAISKIISGKTYPAFSTLMDLTVALECSFGYLCGDEENDDVAAITEMAKNMPVETRRYYRKSGSALVEPEGNGGNKPHAAPKAAKK